MLIPGVSAVQTIFFLLQVFKGYVDDPRNTDNAWMETVAVNFHDESGISNVESCIFVPFKNLLQFPQTLSLFRQQPDTSLLLPQATA